jgi:hypothetical protein
VRETVGRRTFKIDVSYSSGSRTRTGMKHLSNFDE